LAALIMLGAGCSSDSKSSKGTAANATVPSSSASTTGGGDDTAAPSPSAAGAPAVAVPADWPAEVALPTGVVATQASDLGKTQLVVATITGDVQAVFDSLTQQLTDAGYEIVGSTFTPTEQGGFGSISARGTTHTVAIAFGPNDTGKINQVQISVAEVES
jgi:hypothetical protein